MEKPVKRLGMPSESTSRFGLEDIRHILEMLRENGVTEFKIERDGEKLKIKRGEAGASPAAAVTTSHSAPAASPPVAFAAPVAQPAPIPSNPLAEVRTPAPAAVSGLHEVRSPMVGTFYRRPAVDADPYVEIGDSVKKGDVLCIVEAMKLMNEIESDISGRIVEIRLEDGQMAEYGEVLFRIETPK